MKKFKPLDLLKKYRVLIVCVALLAGVVAYFMLNQKQTYTASALIQYTNEDAEQGLAPDGTEIDTSEIYAADVMKEVFTRMNMSYDDYNLDEFRSRVVVKEVMTEEEQELADAKTEKGEEVETKATQYRVSITVKEDEASDPEKFAREILDNMLDIYIQKFGENHASSGAVVNSISKINDTSYDYLEMVDTIESTVSTTSQSLANFVTYNDSYRSTENGYSYGDIYRELSLVLSDDIPEAYAYILGNKVSKDADVLVSKYKQRIEDYKITDEKSLAQIEDIKEIIEAYVSMMRESGNTDITYEYILNEIYDTYRNSSSTTNEDGTTSQIYDSVDETVQYDVLLENYVSDRTSYETNLIEIAYCEYIIGVYEGAEDSSDAVLETAKAKVDALSEKVSDLYDKLIGVNTEYNEYSGTTNVSMKSNVVVTSSVQTLLYAEILAVAMAIVMAIAVVVFGRLGDIVEYYMYYDKKLMLPNRAGCDRYLNKNANVYVQNNFSCMALMLKNIQKKNSEFGKDRCDAMINDFVTILVREVPNNADHLLVVNGTGQFVIFMNNTTEEQAIAHINSITHEVEEYNTTADCKMEFSYGIAEAANEKIFNIRKLMICAINRASKEQEMSDEEITERLFQRMLGGDEESSSAGRDAGMVDANGDIIDIDEMEDVVEAGSDEQLDDLLNRLNNMKKGAAR